MRCCFRSSLLVAALALAAPCASAASDSVLVLGATKDLVHETIAAESNPSSQLAEFTPAGLAGLAMDAYGLATGRVVYLASAGETPVNDVVVQSPAQADVFTHVDAYALVFVDRADAAVLDAVDKATSAEYHKVFDLQDGGRVSTAKIPKVLARELHKAAGGAEILCAGSDNVCSGGLLTATAVSEDDVHAVFSRYAFLDVQGVADQILASELAQTAKVADAIVANADKPSGLYVVSFSRVSALDESKRDAALDAISEQVQRLLHALQTKYPATSGAQLVAAKHGVVRALDSTIAYGRMLLSFKEGVTGSDDDDDDDDSSGSTDGSTNTTTSDVTLQDIAEYQIVLWTSVLLGGVLLLVIIAMCNMEPKRDSLLYAKFTTSSASRKFD